MFNETSYNCDEDDGLGTTVVRQPLPLPGSAKHKKWLEKGEKKGWLGPPYQLPARPIDPPVKADDPAPKEKAKDTTPPTDGGNSGGSFADLFSGIPTNYLLIGGAVLAFFLLKKR